MILGLRTAIYPTPDLVKGKAWYGQVLGCDPYFDDPCYVGFSVGGFELGLIPDGEPGTGGVQVCWGVPDAAAEVVRLEGLGAEVHEPDERRRRRHQGRVRARPVRQPVQRHREPTLPARRGPLGRAVMREMAGPRNAGASVGEGGRLWPFVCVSRG